METGSLYVCVTHTVCLSLCLCLEVLDGGILVQWRLFEDTVAQWYSGGSTVVAV